MNIISNSFLVLYYQKVKHYYQNSFIYKLTERLGKVIANMFKNSYFFGYTYSENMNFKHSMTYKVITWKYNFLSKFVKSIINITYNSIIVILIKKCWRVIEKILDTFFKVYKYSFIYHAYLDWIESEKI